MLKGLWFLIAALAIVAGAIIVLYRIEKHFAPKFACYGISNAEAERMVAAGLDEDLRSGVASKLYREKSISEITVAKMDRDRAPKGHDWYVSMVLTNTSTGAFITNATVFEDCDIEWGGAAPGPDAVVGDVQPITPHTLGQGLILDTRSR
jgi:hypothetical protein